MKILLVTDKCPLPGFADWNYWFEDHLAVLAQTHSIDVLAIVPIFPRFKNLFRKKRTWMWLNSLWSLPSFVALSDNIRIHYLRVVNIPSRLSWSMLPRLLAVQCRARLPRNLQAGSYELCLVHGPYPSGLCGIDLGKRYGIPTAMVCHSGLEIYGTYFRSSAEEVIIRIIQDADVAVALSNEQAMEISQRLPDLRVHTIPHVINQGSTTPALIGHSGMKIITACRMDAPEKDIALLLRAVAELAQDQQVKLTIAGEGFAFPSLVRMARDFGIKEIVRFTGWLNREMLAAELQLHDVYAHVSHFEAFGHAPAVALSNGIPVASLKKIGFLHDAECEQIGCVVAKTPTYDGMAAVLRELQNDPQRRRALGLRGRAYVSQNFSAESHGANYDKLFLELVSDRGSLPKVE